MDNSTQSLLIKLALVGAAGFIVYKLINKAGTVVSGAVTTAANYVGGAAADLLLPNYDPNSPLYEVQFPDASHHLVDSATVTTHFFGPDTFVVPAVTWSAQNGYAGVTMQLLTYAPGSYYAIPA